MPFTYNFDSKTVPLVHRNLDAQIAGTLVAAGIHRLFHYYICNSNAAIRYLKFYDKLTVGLVGDTPIATLLIPAGGAANCWVDSGIPFALGLSYRATTVAADADATAPTAGDVIVNLTYV